MRAIQTIEPNPEHLIKSIAEQGYTLETAVADLIDNSISAAATKIEIVVNWDSEPFELFIADNGNGMNLAHLIECMKIPSSSPEGKRKKSDLGRFGLGLKTASFSQTRLFSVLSREGEEGDFKSVTWDVEHLKTTGKWELIIDDANYLNENLNTYRKLSKSYLSSMEGFNANTIILWKGLYKYEQYLEKENSKRALKEDLSEIMKKHLELVFHRFMEDKDNPLKIRVNNRILTPFNPFPNERDVRLIEDKQKLFQGESITIQGHILPARSIDESLNKSQKNLMDLEGLYWYRGNRVILYGGWNGLVKKSSKYKLARLKIDVGNSIDHLIHLNVAKSKIKIPYDLQKPFKNYVVEVCQEAKRELYNRGLNKFKVKSSKKDLNIFSKIATNKGVILEFNQDHPILKNFYDSLSDAQKLKYSIIQRMISVKINKIRKAHEQEDFEYLESPLNLSVNEIIQNIEELRKLGFDKKQITVSFIQELGLNVNTLPLEIKVLLNE